MVEALLQSPPDSSLAVDWTNYAGSYDLLLDYNPAYQELIATFRSYLSRHSLAGAHCLDVGGGTGNFANALLETKLGIELDFLEPDPGMRTHASRKFPGKPIKFIPKSFEDCEFEKERYILIVCTHALCTMQSPQSALKKLYEAAESGGRLFLIDLTKELNIADWRLYLLRHLLLRNSPLNALRILSRSGAITKENKRVKGLQASGRFWTPSDGEFQSAVADAGWQVDSFRSADRGYSRIVEAVK